jgi:glycosyltransferase involved in cell wall biosynthesis
LVQGFATTRQEMRILPQIMTITDSQFLKDEMVRTGYPAHQIHVLRLPPPEVPVFAPPPSKGVPRFVYLGRLTPHKGVSWILRSLAQVKVPVHVDIAGDGPQLPELRCLADQLGVKDRVTFHGWVEESQTTQLLQSARALILSSVWHEPGATVAVEAMANARAIVMSRVGGMPEVVPGEANGLLVEPNHVEGLAHCMERLASDWSLAKRLGEEGRKMVETHFSIAIHLRKLLELYEQAGSAYPVEAVLSR